MERNTNRDRDRDRDRVERPDIPHIDATDRERKLATSTYPPELIPEEGPIPDPEHHVVHETTIEVPDWMVGCVRWRLRWEPEPDQADVWDILIEYTHAKEVFVTEDGEPVADVLLEEREADS